jgi:hypothetical protein
MENAPQPVPASGDNQTTAGRTVVRLRRDFGTPFESPRWPDGFTVRTLLPSDAATLHALLTLVFDDTEQSFDLWWPKLSGDPEFDAELCFLVFDAAGQLAGAAQCWTGAYLKDLAVRPEARRLGITARPPHIPRPRRRPCRSQDRLRQFRRVAALRARRHAAGTDRRMSFAAATPGLFFRSRRTLAFGSLTSARARHAARRPVGLAACVVLATLAFRAWPFKEPSLWPGESREARRWIGASISKIWRLPSASPAAAAPSTGSARTTLRCLICARLSPQP